MNTKCDFETDGKCNLLDGNCTADNERNQCQINTAKKEKK